MLETVELKVNGQIWRLKPTYGAVRRLEDEIAALQSLYQANLAGLLKLHEAAQIIAIGMNDYEAGAAEAETVAEDLFEHLGPASDAVKICIASYLAGLAWTPAEAKKKLAQDLRLQPETPQETLWES